MKNFRTVLWLSIISLVGLLPMLFSSDAMNSHEVDVYLFYDYKMSPELIAYDIAEILTVTTFIYLIWRLIPTKREKRYVFCFLIASMNSVVGYFLFYSQMMSLVQIPLLILMLAYVYYTYDYEKRNHAR